MIKNFRDLLAILIGVVAFPGIWVLQGMNIMALPESVIGATIAIETLIAQFYFRKASSTNGS